MKRAQAPMSDKFELILPFETVDKLKARAAALSVAPGELIKLALERAHKKGPTYLRVLAEKVNAIDAAMASHTPASWPSNFDESLVVGALLWKTVKRSGENYLLQLSGSKMDIIETICRKRGINYEEAIREAVVAALSGQTSQDQNPRTEELLDWDEADQ
jgi:hypothetical protein